MERIVLGCLRLRTVVVAIAAVIVGAGIWQLRQMPLDVVPAFILVIEHEKTHREIRANLLASATTFTVPEGFLAPGLEYKVAIATVAKDGNRSFTETAFTRVERK